MECATNFACFGSSNPIHQARKVDTNVIEINLGCLKTTTALATGDPYFCKKCGSLFNSSSVLIRSDNFSIWTCEFCSVENSLSIEEEERPKHLELTYLLEGPQAKAEEPRPEENLGDTTSIIFCIDYSGSMGMTKQIPGRLQLRTNKSTNNADFTIVSRLECMQAAVESQIQSFLATSPNKKVGIVAFESSVKIIGDGAVEEIIPREVLGHFDRIMEYYGQKRGVFLNNPITATADRLSEKLMNLRPSGGTALGPALLSSILIAAEGGRGSKVVICTDGLANEGVGSLSGQADQDSFYKEVASISKELGVSVSVISIEGQECKLESLAIVTEETGGSIVKVAPESLTTEFASIMSDDVIATQVSVQVTLHKTVLFKNEPVQVLSLSGSRMDKDIGNATPSSSFSFHYAIKSDEELLDLGIDKHTITSIPFQTLFRYSTLDGRKCMRAITKIQKVTFNREEVEQEVDIDILARAGRRRAVKLAEEGKLEEAKQDSDMWKVMLKEEAKDEKTMAKAQEFDDDCVELAANIDSQLEKEEKQGIRGEEMDEQEKVRRRKNYGDNFIVGMSKMKKKK